MKKKITKLEKEKKNRDVLSRVWVKVSKSYKFFEKGKFKQIYQTHLILCLNLNLYYKQ